MNTAVPCRNDPALLVETGHSFERIYAERWLELYNTCPLTRVPITNKLLARNLNLKQNIKEWRAKLSRMTRQSTVRDEIRHR